MQANNPYAKMKENSIMTAPKEELTLMLYDGAIKFINIAIIAIENKDTMKAHDNIIKVQNIIREFQITLDRKYDISEDLNRLYNYIFRRLIDANTTKNIDTLKECSDLIRNMRDTWKEAMVLARSGNAANVGF